MIENTQRDLNIALVNELAIIFNRLEIDTEAVLRAAGSKWNFLPFRPGLVGGHCIGVDPYYLTHKSQGIGYYPEIILAGRRLNDNMGNYVSGQLIKAMIKKAVMLIFLTLGWMLRKSKRNMGLYLYRKSRRLLMMPLLLPLAMSSLRRWGVLIFVALEKINMCFMI